METQILDQLNNLYYRGCTWRTLTSYLSSDNDWNFLAYNMPHIRFISKNETDLSYCSWYGWRNHSWFQISKRFNYCVGLYNLTYICSISVVLSQFAIFHSEFCIRQMSWRQYTPFICSSWVFKQKKSRRRKFTKKWRGFIVPLFGVVSRDSPPVYPPIDIKRKNRIEGHQFE